MKKIESMLNFLADKIKKIEKRQSNYRVMVNEYPSTGYNRGFVFEPEGYNGKGDRYFLQITAGRRLYIGTQLNGASEITWREI